MYLSRGLDVRRRRCGEGNVCGKSPPETGPGHEKYCEPPIEALWAGPEHLHVAATKPRRDQSDES